MTIKHLVLSAGGLAGFSMVGILKELNRQDFFHIKDLKTIHATSIGTILSTLLLLSNDIELVENYIVNRPWDKFFSINPNDIINLWEEKGILGEEIILEVLKPFLQARDLKITITLKEFYETLNIELYFYTTNLNATPIESVELSYITFPDLELYKAIAMSSALPLIFVPIIVDNNCYIDGGAMNHFPLNKCLEKQYDPDEIFAIKIMSKDNNAEMIDKESLLSTYMNAIISKLVYHSYNDAYKNIENIIVCETENNSVIKWISAISSRELRNEYIVLGANYAKSFLESKASKASKASKDSKDSKDS
jgi:predicted acylesterase/phospholipase RssA